MARILILWNQIDDDVYEHFRRDGKRAADWDPNVVVEPWDTVEDEMMLIVRALEGAGHEVSMVNIRDSFVTLHDAVTRLAPDAIMNLVEFFRDDPEQEHHVPAVYELLGLAYTGNRPLSLSLCQKKPQAKAVLASHGIPTPKGVVIERGKAPKHLDLAYPLIVKPAFDDASGGIDSGSVVHDRAALDARVNQLLKENRQAALVEEYIEGREIHCAILADHPLPLYEMEFLGGLDDKGVPMPRIITYRAKWDPYSREHHQVRPKCPVEDLDPVLAAKIQGIAVSAYEALGCRDYARVDMRVTPAGDVYVLEVNPNPDLADSCAFAKSAEAAGRSYNEMIVEIVGLALARKGVVTPIAAGFDTLLHEYQAKKRQSQG